MTLNVDFALNLFMSQINPKNFSTILHSLFNYHTLPVTSFNTFVKSSYFLQQTTLSKIYLYFFLFEKIQYLTKYRNKISTFSNFWTNAFVECNWKIIENCEKTQLWTELTSSKYFCRYWLSSIMTKNFYFNSFFFPVRDGYLLRKWCL